MMISKLTVILSLWIILPLYPVWAEAPHFKVGVSLPLTGAFAEYGIAVKNGIELARSDHPELLNGVDFLLDDDHYDPKSTVTIFNRMIDIEHVNLMFVWGNEPALGAGPLAERREMPTVVVAQHPKAAAGLHYVIRFINPAADYSKAIATYLQTNSWHKLGVIKSEISFFNILIEELKTFLPADTKLIEFDSFLPTDSDFRPLIAKLKGQNFDALGVYLVPPQVSQFYRQAAEQNYHPKTFGSTTFESASVMKDALGYMEGAVYSHVAADPAFAKRYLSKVGNDNQISYAANAYDFATIVGKLFGSADHQPSADEILTSFQNIPNGTGATGPYSFQHSATSGNYFEFRVMLKKVEGADIILINGK